MQDVVEFLKEHGDLKVIDTPLDVELEIPHVAYIEVKKDNSRPILFTKPVNRAKGIEYDAPVLMNIFANKDITRKIFAKEPDSIGKAIDDLMKFKPPKGLLQKLKMLPKILELKSVFPKRQKGRGESQEVVIKGADVNLDKLPILKTWEEDGGAFITMGQVYTQSLDGQMQNVGMYRLQQLSNNKLAMHWQIHKDASNFFDQYAKANKKMPVSIGIGGDPLYIWCGQAPMPHGVFELLLYGLISGKNAKLVKSITNDIYVPSDVDYVIEGFVDPKEFAKEGPFGDHTGYYTLVEDFPVMQVSAITHKAKPVFAATVVGKPPLEDKYFGWATERIFLPLLKPLAPELIDYNMPENGVFHNLILAKMHHKYPGHAKQFMHAFWGVGQMSFVKHAIFVKEDAPALEDYQELSEYILNRVSKEKIFISEGVVDHLDHSSPKQFVGGKLGVDATGEVVSKVVKQIEDSELLDKMQAIDSSVVALKTYFSATANPITVIAVEKSRSQLELFKDLEKLKDHLAIVVVVDKENNDLDNPYMLIWRVVNNIDSNRDVLLEPFIAIDGTNKNSLDGFNREWPKDANCTKEVLDKLQELKVIDIDEEFIKKFGLLDYNLYS
jgi:4-hydroxy-3-polyprenylbenzoate decarboxylase